jgi:hypothetical protein
VLDFIRKTYPGYAETYRRIYVLGDKSYWREASDSIDEYFRTRGGRYSKFL